MRDVRGCRGMLLWRACVRVFLCGVEGERVRECFRGVFQCCVTASGRLLLIYWVGCAWALSVFLVFRSVNVLHFSKKKNRRQEKGVTQQQT